LAGRRKTFLANLIRGLVASGVHVRVATSRRPDATWLALPNFSWLPAPKWRHPSPAGLLHTGRHLGRAALNSGRDLASYQTANADVAGWARLELLGRWLPFAGQRWDVLYFPWNSSAIEHLPLFDERRQS
jgi:hypothetical protein